MSAAPIFEFGSVCSDMQTGLILLIKSGDRNCKAGGSVNGTALTEANFATFIQGSGSSGTATGTTFVK